MLTITNGPPPGISGLQTNTVICYIRINGSNWLKSPFRSSFKTRETAEKSKTIAEFVQVM